MGAWVLCGHICNGFWRSGGLGLWDGISACYRRFGPYQSQDLAIDVLVRRIYAYDKERPDAWTPWTSSKSTEQITNYLGIRYISLTIS